MLYEWIKALHIISIIAWMAGLLYLPRLFVYHADAKLGSDISDTFKIMEYRLYYAIMTPAMIASWLFGLALIVLNPDWLSFGWMHAKLLFVLILTASHGMMGRWRRKFASDENIKSSKFYRLVNEIPTLLMIGIVIFVVVKPF